MLIRLHICSKGVRKHLQIYAKQLLSYRLLCFGKHLLQRLACSSPSPSSLERYSAYPVSPVALMPFLLTTLGRGGHGSHATWSQKHLRHSMCNTVLFKIFMYIYIYTQVQLELLRHDSDLKRTAQGVCKFLPKRCCCFWFVLTACMSSCLCVTHAGRVPNKASLCR